MTRPRHQHARPRRARLTRVLHAVVHTRGNRLVERRIVQHDEGGLATQFEAHLLDAVTGHRRDAATGLQGTGEAHHVDVGMRDDGFADRPAGAGDDVQHAGGEADFVRGFGEHEGADRRHLGGLQHHRAAGRERRRNFANDLV